MNEQEAIKYMEDEIRCIQKAPYCEKDCANCSLVKEEEPLLESFGIVIQALEKQIPKKIVVQHFPKTSWTREVTKYECPCCNRFLGFNGLNYCPNCGQKLDWR